MPEDLRRLCWQVVLHCAKVLPAGLLWGTGIALSMSQDHTIETVIVVALVVFGAVTALAYKPVLQTANIGCVALNLAFYVVFHRVFSGMHASEHGDESLLVDEVVSCLREYAVIMACVSSALAMACPPGRGQTLDLFPVERPNPLAPEATTLLALEAIGPTQPGDSELFSNAGSLPFRHVGPTSHYSGSSDISNMTLSSSSDRADPLLVQRLGQLSMKANPVVLVRGDDASPEPQPELID